MSVAVQTRKNTASVTREHKFLGGNRRTCVSKNFDKTVRLQYEKGKKRVRELKGERLQGITEGASSALRLASLSATSFPERNECLGSHCSLIEQEEREDSSCQINQRVSGKRKNGGEDRVVRTERESDRRGREEKWQTCWCCRDQYRNAEWPRLQRKNLNILSLPKSKKWPRCHRESRWQERQSHLCLEEKEQSRQSKAPDREAGESQGGRDPHLGERERERGIRARAWGGKGGLHSERRQIPRRKERASKKSLPGKSRRRHERARGRKSSPGRSVESWCHSKSSQT